MLSSVVTNNILDYLCDRVLLCDGGTGSLIQTMNLSTELDFLGKENCTEVLVLSRPDIIRSIHVYYFEAGADCVETNTFGASPITLADFGLAEQTLEINRQAVRLAREAAEQFTRDGRTRFVLGAVGPGTKLPSLGQIDYDTLESAYTVQCQGLVEADALLIETCQDPLQIKAAVNGARAACASSLVEIPIFIQVTVEKSGTLLIGTDIAAVTTVVHSLNVPLIGLNCATGPQEMVEHIQWLSQNWPGFISVQPNAGLPKLINGCVHYPLQPADLSLWLKRFVQESGVSLVGGCCGTTPDHIRSVDAMLRALDQRGHWRPEPIRREVHWVPAIASLYNQVPLRQEKAFLSIGERCNANGSKKFRQLQASDNWNGIVTLAREQVAEGSHALDICTAFVGREEWADMVEVVTHLRGTISVPLVIDSTDTAVIEAALKLYGGKAIINSITFEDGEVTAANRLLLARRFGACVIGLTIDENGMAKTVNEKVQIAHRLYKFAVDLHGLSPTDLIIDPLTFTICTGNSDDTDLAINTLRAVKRIRSELPECQIVLGISNISFGLKPKARHVLNSVFLDQAIHHGMTTAIVQISHLLPIHLLSEVELNSASNLIYYRQDQEDRPLKAFMDLFQNPDSTHETVVNSLTESSLSAIVLGKSTLEERLRRHIVDGNRDKLEEDLRHALKIYTPLTIINDILLIGMKEVGDLFGQGRMQLPFVLQSAEVMKAAVAWLEPFMKHGTVSPRATIVLATVKGDVHDIGKNLVDIILTNNGYRVVNLGIRQPISAILEATYKYKADAVGMSGLLVKSTVIMRENLKEMASQGLTIPVILGGAALTRRFVEEDCFTIYRYVSYAKDAFAGLDLMEKVGNGQFTNHDSTLSAVSYCLSDERANSVESTDLQQISTSDNHEEKKKKLIPLHRVDSTVISPSETTINPPFWGTRLVEEIPIDTILPYLNESTLYQFQWGFRKLDRSYSSWKEWTSQEVRPILDRLLHICREETILQPRAIYGYWPCVSQGNSVLLFEPEDYQRLSYASEVARFTFPRQSKDGGLCLTDFFQDINKGKMDIVGLQVVTIGDRVSEIERVWFSLNKYQDYLYLHGLSVEMAEALAEYIHKMIRVELGFAKEEPGDLSSLLKQKYRGARYSFGYPACPNLADQRKLLSLLGAERIGVSLSDEDQLYPEQSTSAIVCLHPQAKYFVV